ncbi:hypothetical protein [Microcoleus sp. PH2017_36_ELK_O_B]|nr:hypothetical protein [Microcoleus sp. PH2017_36_ELK_O_B]MCC3620770.1 hypothetical protein [Microcoleus sp. PH2017_36_ELK_O_B]
MLWTDRRTAIACGDTDNKFVSSAYPCWALMTNNRRSYAIAHKETGFF